MALQNPYTRSIHPKSIADIRTPLKFKEFMDYFERDCNNFVASCSHYHDLVVRFSEIRRELNKKKILNKYLLRVDRHSRLTNYRVGPIQEHLNLLWNYYVNRNTEIYKSCQDDIGRNISLPPTQEELGSFTADEVLTVKEAVQELELNYINFIVGITGLIDSTFFAFESECKTFCSLACFGFSIFYALDEIIQHKDIWLTLKRLGNAVQTLSTDCEICLMKENCRFSINFEALANVYCYAIKVRMLADYEDFFYTTQIWEGIKVYFDKLKHIMHNQALIKDKCLEKELWQVP